MYVWGHKWGCSTTSFLTVQKNLNTTRKHKGLKEPGVQLSKNKLSVWLNQNLTKVNIYHKTQTYHMLKVFFKIIYFKKKNQWTYINNFLTYWHPVTKKPKSEQIISQPCTIQWLIPHYKFENHATGILHDLSKDLYWTVNTFKASLQNYFKHKQNTFFYK